MKHGSCLDTLRLIKKQILINGMYMKKWTLPLLSLMFTGIGCSGEESIQEAILSEAEKPTYENNNTVAGEDDILVQVTGGTGTRGGDNLQIPEEEMKKTWDNDRSTYYKGGGQPATFIYEFSGNEVIDYCLAYPLHPTDDRWYGAWGEVEVWIKENGEGKDFEKVIEKELGESGMVVTFPFEGRKKLKAVKITVKNGAQGFIHCGDVQFFRRANDLFDYNTLFKDRTCSELKDGITEEDIKACPEPFYEILAQALFDGTYPTKFRIQEFEARPEPGIHGKANYINSFSRYENVTGIYTNAGEELTVFVGDIPAGQNVGIKVKYWGNHEDDYALREGINKIKVERKGLVYVMYHKSVSDDIAPVKIHFATGKVNGYFDIAKHTKEEWKDIINNTCCDFFDMLGRRVHLAFSSQDFKQYCQDPFALMEAYDEIVDLAEDFQGLNKYDRQLTNHITINYNTGTGGAMGAGNGVINWNNSSGLSIPSAVQVEKAQNDSWGVAHELGHELQLRPGRSRYNGMLEVTNNLIPAYIQLKRGLESRLFSTEKVSSPKTGHQSEFERAMTYYQAEGRPHNYNMNGTRTVLSKLIPLWQLYVYSAEVLGKDWFKDYYQKLWEEPYVGENGEAQMQVVRIFCEVSGLNLIEFFKMSGFLTPISDKTDTNDPVFTVTEEMIKIVTNEIEAKSYPKPDVEIWRLTDQKENIEAFKNKSQVVKGIAKQAGNVFEMKGWKNVVAYEVYTDGKLVYVSPHDKFEVKNAEVNYSTFVMAVSATGQKEKITF